MQDSLYRRIREQAYMIWLNEGRPEGRDLEHWRQAEQKVRDYSQTQTDSVHVEDVKPTGKPADSGPTKRASRAKNAKSSSSPTSEEPRSTKSPAKRTARKTPRK